MAFDLNYSSVDRLLHHVAFAAPAVQLGVADIEHFFFSRLYNEYRAPKPIFITSLPRAGTTLILELLHRFPSVATHTYRDMPFVMAPIVWSRLSGLFRKQSELRERAHGDGVSIGYDSPEAFEEVIWRTFWPGKYAKSRIDLWADADVNDLARAFLTSHMRKIVALRRPDRRADGRYVSKNNGNIARLNILHQLFPDATIVVVLRHPSDHVRSLLHQHRSFLEMHRKSPFVRQYMADIGHYEFGELHRPIRFPGLESLIADRDPLTVDYWLAYWVAAFEHIQRITAKAVLVSYEAMCLESERTLSGLCQRLEIPDENIGKEAAPHVRSHHPTTRLRDADPDLLNRAEDIYHRLLEAPLIVK